MAAKEQPAPAQGSNAAANPSNDENEEMPQDPDMFAVDPQTSINDATTERIPSIDKAMDPCIPKCQMPPRDVIEPVENVVSAAVEEQHNHASNKKNNSDISEEVDGLGKHEQWIFPKKPTSQDETGNYRRPSGRAPVGRFWDASVGAWRLNAAK